MYRIMYGDLEVAVVQGKKEAMNTLSNFRIANPKSDRSLWRMVKC